MKLFLFVIVRLFIFDKLIQGGFKIPSIIPNEYIKLGCKPGAINTVNPVKRIKRYGIQAL